LYILFEGVDTSGKSTQIELLKKSFSKAIFTKEPGATKIGSKIRQMALFESDISKRCELFLFLADGAEHFEKVIKPNKDKVIFSDRGLISGIAYALANDESLETKRLIEFNRFALQESLPDIVFVFKTTKKLLFKRLSSKSHDSIEKRGVEYLLRVQEYILKVCKRLEIEMHEIDASKKIEEINKEILLVLESKGVKS